MHHDHQRKRGALAALAGAALVLIPAAQAEAASLRLPPPGVWYAYEGAWCASMNVPKGGREGTIHEWVWKDRDGVLHCEYAGARKMRS